MKYLQKKIGVKRSFEFFDKEFSYSEADESSQYTRKYRYVSLPSQSEFYSLFESNMLMFIGSICFLLVGAIQYVAMEIVTGTPKFTMGTIGIIFFIIYIYKKTKFTMIPIGNINISVMHDEQKDEIIRILYSKRKAILRSKYCVIDSRLSLEDEIAKYSYLRDEDVISEEEYKSHVNEAKEYHKVDNSHLH